MPPIRVFVSYAHQDNLRDEVGALVDWLNEQEGIEAIADHCHSVVPPSQGWPAWMLHNLEGADVVLCICGEFYKRGFEKRGGSEDSSKGTPWEGAIVTVDLYEARGENTKYFPILPQANAHACVPVPLKPWDNNIALAEREKILALIQHKRNDGKLPPNNPPEADTQCLKFRNLQRETDSKLARASNFLRLRFAERATQYVPHEEVWQAFEGFYVAPESFSWWLIVGSAGSGKSRTALEFCEFLKQKNWNVGFLNLEQMPLETWQTWQPKQDTLLVIDYVAKEFSGYPEDISRIFTQLTRRAEKKELGGKRIRILLLEREYTERGQGGRWLQWYEWLDKGMCYQSPFDLSTVSDKGLYKIAAQAAKDIWESPNPLPSSSDFLDKLTQLDTKKRPLFAMLLAGYLAKLNPKAEISPNEVLDFAIEQEFERSLAPAGVADDADLLRALLLSTCTGGKRGALPLQPRHSLLWNSGLGKLREEKGQNLFAFYPMEPDLLGERFVLNCVSGNPFKQRIGKRQLEELLKTCWLEAPQETADFFTRCAQDFASSNSEKIAKLFLSAVPMVNGNTPLRVLFVKTLLSLTDIYGSAAKRQEAWKLLEGMARLGKMKEITLLSALASFKLVVKYRNAGSLPEELKLLDEMLRFYMPIGFAYSYMLDRLGSTEMLPDAWLKDVWWKKDMYLQRMAQFGDTSETKLEHACAAFWLIVYYGAEGNFPEAQKLFEEMAGFGDTPEMELWRAKAAVELITYYCKAEKLPEAQKLFEEMAGLGDTPEMELWRAKAAVELIIYYRNAKKLLEEQKLFEEMARWGDAPEIALWRAQAADDLDATEMFLDAWCDEMLPYDATSKMALNACLDEAVGWDETQEMALEHAHAAFLLICCCGKAGKLPEAQKLFEEMAGLGDMPEMALLRAKAAYNLIFYYKKAGNLPEAQKLFKEMAGLGDTPEIASLRDSALKWLTQAET